MSRIRCLTLTAALLATTAFAVQPALAQDTAWGESGYVSFNGMYQANTRTYTTTTEQTLNQEAMRLTATHESGPRVLYDFTSGGRIVGNLGVGFAASYGKGDTDATITGGVPHPFYFDQPRVLQGTASVDREDLAIHIAAMWLIPATRDFQLAVFAGPTWFQVKHDVVSSIDVEDAYPFDTVSLRSVGTEERKGSRFGYNAGADVSYFFSQYLGVHGLVRYSDGSVKLGGEAGTVKVGGLQVGAGLRIRY